MSGDPAMHTPLDPAAAAFLAFLASEQAKRGPRPTDPIEQVLATRAGYRGIVAAAGAPEVVQEIRNFEIATPAGRVPARLYRPAPLGQGVALYLHGGGFVSGDLETHDAQARALANRTHRTVLAIDYRLAPEHAYPAALEDALSALDWLHAEASNLGTDTRRIAVLGDSAGGELALALCIANRDRNGPAIERQVLIYPMGDMAPGRADRWPSIREHEGKILTEADMDRNIAMYLGGADPHLATLSPAGSGDLSRLPPAIVITAGHDPLRDEGEAVARRLAEAGVAVDHWRFPSQIHAFFQLAAYVSDAVVAMDRIAAALSTPP
jgi:acetyl esterase